MKDDNSICAQGVRRSAARFVRVKREAGENPAQQPLLCFDVKTGDGHWSASLRRQSVHRGNAGVISQETCLAR